MTLVLAVVTISIVTGGLVFATYVSSNTATQTKSAIKTIGVELYWDQGCTNRTDTLNWGELQPNTTKSLTVYIKNTGTIPVRLSMSTDDWNPTTAQNYITLTWNRENSILNRGGGLTATFTLELSPEAANLTGFSFDATIIAVQKS